MKKSLSIFIFDTINEAGQGDENGRQSAGQL
jgi:hypothetical protein